MKELMRIFYQLLGNKRYLYDLENILDKLDLSPKERQTMNFLKNDLQSLQMDVNKLQTKAKQPWRIT